MYDLKSVAAKAATAATVPTPLLLYFLLASWLSGKWVIRFFGNDTERTLCTKSVNIRKRGDSIKMIATIGLL